MLDVAPQPDTTSLMKKIEHDVVPPMHQFITKKMNT
jgi:hypothetical protein